MVGHVAAARPTCLAVAFHSIAVLYAFRLIFPISKHGPVPFEALDENGAVDRSGDLRIGVLGGSHSIPETGPGWRS